MFSFTWALHQVFLGMLAALTHPVFWIVMALVALQYGRVAELRRNFLGAAGNKVLSDTALAAAYGFAGGIVGSLLIVLTGLTLNGTAFQYLLPLAIVLMLIHPRFLCFSYSGGLLALANLFFGFPAIDIPQVMALVAILHFVEAVLILFSGHIGAVPAYVRLTRDRIVGAFTLQKFWPIPIVALLVVGALPQGAEGVQMPGWWPLIPASVPGNPDNLVYIMLPVVAALGYSDIALARTPVARSRISAVHLTGFSITLFALAYLAAQNQGFVWLAALFSPLGHELTIHIGKRGEFGAKPRYVPGYEGVGVLDVERNSPAWRAGIRSGDVITEVNGIAVFRRADLQAALAGGGTTEVGYLEDGRTYRRQVVIAPSGRRFGVLTVPEGDEERVLELRPGGLERLWNRLKS
ncbi:PDZ domain-containing protein [Desulforudis sp. DRI-14]|uniref:PDZ domain-containing protein n=1 Tax=Desulforudis sp. DRI-14 TaxID=3459793 RepID=UPI003BD95786